MVGHSFGGGVSMQMLYLFPDLVRDICLIASGGLGQEVNPVLRAASLPGSEIAMSVAASAAGRGTLGTLLVVLKRLRIVSLTAGDRRAWTNFASIAGPATRRAFLATARSVINYCGQSVSATRLLSSFSHVFGAAGVGRERHDHSPRARTLRAKPSAARDYRSISRCRPLPASRRTRNVCTRCLLLHVRSRCAHVIRHADTRSRPENLATRKPG